MTITGHQIREARRLLKRHRESLVKRAKLSFSVARRAEASDGEGQHHDGSRGGYKVCPEAAGVEFVQEDGGVGVQPREAER